MPEPAFPARAVPESERRAVEAARHQLGDRAAVLREQAEQVTALRAHLPLPCPRCLPGILESARGLARFPALELAVDLECAEDTLYRAARSLERISLGLPPGLEAGEGRPGITWPRPPDEPSPLERRPE